jgi:class 3 adenylate cyclase
MGEAHDPESAIFDAILLPGVEERTVSAAEIEARGGSTVEEIGRLMAAWGLPIPAADQPAFTPEEAHVFIEVKALEELWPIEVGVQIARIYGRLLQRIAQTELQLFRLHVEGRLRREDDDPFAALRTTQDAFARLLPLADPLLTGVHRRWIEHELAQAAVREAESETTEPQLPGAVEVALLFCDLKDFTAYADTEGDAAAVAAIDRFADVVTYGRGPGSRFMKALGDGYMLSYRGADEAVGAGARIIADMRADDLPGVHASVHQGVAIAREGDYFGGAVNLAARLLAAAARDELVATTAAVEAAGPAFAWEPAGSLRVRGVATPVEVFRLAA